MRFFDANTGIVSSIDKIRNDISRFWIELFAGFIVNVDGTGYGCHKKRQN